MPKSAPRLLLLLDARSSKYNLLFFQYILYPLFSTLIFRRNKCTAIVQLMVVTLTKIVSNFAQTNKVYPVARICVLSKNASSFFLALSKKPRGLSRRSFPTSCSENDHNLLLTIWWQIDDDDHSPIYQHHEFGKRDSIIVAFTLDLLHTMNFGNLFHEWLTLTFLLAHN